MKTVDHIIDRLEVRRMSVGRLNVNWCPCCLHVIVKDPEVKTAYVIWLGEEGCRQPIKSGTISEAIADLRSLEADTGSVT